MCKECRRCFSASSFKTTYRQKRPDINERLRRELAEGVGIRPAARSLGVSKTTILRKLRFLGQLSEQVCREKREQGELKTSYVQFDELMAFERTQCLPVTIALAVRPKTGEIVTALAGSIPCKTVLARRSRMKYGPRDDHRERTVRQMLRDVKQCFKDGEVTIASDSWIEYAEWIKEEMPNANYDRHIGSDLRLREKAMATVDERIDPIDYSETTTYGPLWKKRQKNGKLIVKAFDPLFAVNQKCMKLRASLSRLRRDFWGYTQSIENLQLHLWLFVAIHNGYELPTKRKVGIPKTPTPEPENPKLVLPSIALPDLSTLPSETCSLYATSVVMIGAPTQKAGGFQSMGFYRAEFDPERKVLALAFCDSPEPGFAKVPRSAGGIYINIGALLRRAGFKPVKGRVPIYLDQDKGSAYVVLGDVLIKKVM